jgi:hypothetical protein
MSRSRLGLGTERLGLGLGLEGLVCSLGPLFDTSRVSLFSSVFFCKVLFASYIRSCRFQINTIQYNMLAIARSLFVARVMSENVEEERMGIQQKIAFVTAHLHGYG